MKRLAVSLDARMNLKLIPRRSFHLMSLIQVLSYSAVLMLSSQSSTGIEASADVQTCNVRQVAPGRIVCVCNTTTVCDELKFEWPEQTGSLLHVQSTRAGKRFETARVDAQLNDVSNSRPANKLLIDLSDEKQPILGWGGAFTDAALVNIDSLSSEVAEKLLQSYFGSNGLRYNFVRVPIAGTDFSTRAYSYDDTDLKPDYDLTHWTLAHEDITLKIPYLKRAIRIAADADLEPIKLFASSWSPPKWMKTNKSFVRGHLLKDAYEVYANYLLKFFLAYKEHGLNFWGATVQNEPFAAYLPIYFFNSLQMNSSEVIDFVGNHLGPKLEQNNFNKENFKLMVGDDSLGFVNSNVKTIMKDPKVQRHVSGLAFHWYTSGYMFPYSYLSNLVDSIKDKIEFTLMTEACTGSLGRHRGVSLGSWSRGYSYASDITQDLLHSANGWIDWNVALDIAGGPNWAKNVVDSPIVVDAKKNEFYLQPMYYALAHFTRFFTPGSIRVRTELKSKKLEAVAVNKKDTGHLVISVISKASKNQKLNVQIKGSNHTLTVDIEPDSFNTLVLKL